MRIGIFGGAFDPPHKGHEKALEAFLEEAKLDLVYVIPAGDPPHKSLSGDADGAHRLEMCRRAFLPLSEKVRVSDLELIRDGASYTYLTLSDLKTRHPGEDLFLFVGTDQLLAFETWKRVPLILSSCTLCAMDRFDDPSLLAAKKRQLEKDFGAQLLILQEKPYIISSTQIRAELRENGFSDALSPDVNDEIFIHSLYGIPISPEKRALLSRCQTLSPPRFAHTLSVMRCVLTLADLFGLDREKKEQLSLAALYHDLTKEWPENAHKAMLEKHGEDLSILSFPSVVHSVTASLLAKEEGLLSENMICAIRSHTTARPGMTLEEKLLYFADFIEERRSYPACRRARSLFFEGLPSTLAERERHLDKCVLLVMEETIRSLARRGLPPHPLGERALADLKNKVERNPP